ncbi:MAG: AI-2E family transporter [Clostridia bacterium]|nr:AI-2E family transporter [Clostridia bacterium]
MSDREHPLSRWFGERKIVRLMLLAALLALGVIHFQWLIEGVAVLWRIARPIIVGGCIAYILEIVVKRLEKYFAPNSKNKWILKSRRCICILLASVLVLGIIVLLIFTVIPGLKDAFKVLSRELPNYFTQLKTWALEKTETIQPVHDYVLELELDWTSVQDRVINWAMNGVVNGGLLSSTVSVISAVTGQVANFLISVIFAIFLLVSKAELQSQFLHVLQASVEQKKRSIIQHVLETSNRCFSGFIVGQTLNGLILGILTWLGMRIFGMPYALMVGVLSGTASLIPIIGGYIGAALGTFLVFTQNPSLALWFLLFIVVLQNIQGNLLYPRLVGNSVGLPGIWVLAAVSVGGGLGGIGGMLIAVPMTATGYALLKEWVQKRNASEPDGELPAPQEASKAPPTKAAKK